MSKVCLVTGGSRGIGAAVCRLAARDGYDVAIVWRKEEARARAVLGQVEAAGRRGITLQADICDERQVEAMFDRTEQELGAVDALVSNGGIIHEAGPLADLDVAVIRRVVETDLVAHLICNREAVRRMSTRRGWAKGGKGGVIVNISSRASELFGAGGFVPYAAAKGGIDVLTIGLGREAGPDGVRVAGLRPGLIDTDMQNDTGIADRIAKGGPTVPIGRAGTPEEVAEAVVWLLSDKARYVTGTVFDVAGGR
ncbi:MAG: SDR family oxidoreductase [Geminicoccaceae bacterium]|nr:SDR family oxidoreductase [Geminicoccaceae bacterium]